MMETQKQQSSLNNEHSSENIEAAKKEMPEVLEEHTPADEKEELELRKQRTHFASSKPDKNHVG